MDETGLTPIRDLPADRRGSVVLVPIVRGLFAHELRLLRLHHPRSIRCRWRRFLHAGTLTKLLRESGAYFIRRSFSDDPLYTAVFRAYTQYLVSRG